METGSGMERVEESKEEVTGAQIPPTPWDQSLPKSEHKSITPMRGSLKHYNLPQTYYLTPYATLPPTSLFHYCMYEDNNLYMFF